MGGVALMKILFTLRVLEKKPCHSYFQVRHKIERLTEYTWYIVCTIAELARIKKYPVLVN